MQALALINLAAREYQDVAFVRIAKDPAGAAITNGANWLDYLNDAQLAVVQVRPDANSVTSSFQLVAGTKQSLPAGGLRMLAPTRNMGATGAVPGRALAFGDRETQDLSDPDWHTSATGTMVKEVFYDERRDPLAFWVRPPIPASPQVWIEAQLSKSPALLTDADNDPIGLSDVYVPPMIQWMLYRASAMATQSPGQFSRAQFYFSAFFNLLGVKLKGDMWVGQRTPDYLPPVAMK